VVRPKLEGAVKRSSTRGWIAARWSDAALRMAQGSRFGLIAEADSRRKPRARESGDLWVLVSECRLQRSVRRIFPVSSR
jgi:hypothetical protein